MNESKRMDPMSGVSPVSLSTESLIKAERGATVERRAARRILPRDTMLWGILISLAIGFAVSVALWHGGWMVWEDTHHLIVYICLISLLLLAGSFALISGQKSYRERSILHEIFHGSHIGRLITDISRKDIFCNDGFKNLLDDLKPQGPDSQIPLGLNGLASLRHILSEPADSRERFDLMVDLAYRGGHEKIELQTTITGYPRWLRIEAQPVPGWIGTVAWRIDDFTEQYELEAAIRSEREKLIDFTDNAPVGFFSVNQDGRFLFVNATLARWLGADIESLLVSGRLHHYLAEPPIGAQPYDLVAEGGARQVVELRMKGPGGKLFQAAINQSVVHEEDGRVRTRAVVHDLTSEREMRQALKDSEDRFLRFFQEAPLGIALVDTHGMLNDCNTALALMLGMKIESVEGRNFDMLIADKDRQKVTAAMAQIEEGRSLLAPLEVTLKGLEREVVVQMHARKFRGQNTVVHFIDLTEQKTLEAQFTQSQKMQAVGQLAGGVAHDFNNLLTAMIGFCDLLLLRHKPGDPSFNDIMQIKQNANRAANLVRQLLAFSRQQTLQPKVLDITETLTELSHLLRRLIGVTIDLEIQHDPHIGLIKVDEGQLEQVLVNLTVNGRDAINSTNGGRGKVSIHTENVIIETPIQRGADVMPVGEWVMLSVSDTGCGIPRDIINRIFEPFFTTKPIGSGTGLGLSTVYGIVRQTGGYVHVDSVVGQGTTFRIYFPRVAREALQQGKALTHATEKAADLTGTASILLVEDEDAVRAFSSRALINKGYKVYDAPSGEAALELLAAHKDTLNLVVTDVIMPEMDGPTLIGIIRKQCPDLPVIFVSGYTEDKFKEQFGARTYFLPKPFTLQQLAAKVKEVLSE